MTKASTCVYHFLALGWYIFLNYYVSNSEGNPQKAKIFQNGGQWKYLTFLNLAIFYGVAFLDDVMKRITRKKDIKFVTAFRDLLFTSLAFPTSTCVFLLFWVLYLYDRELVYPKVLDGIFPEWLNHAMHTSIWPLTLMEFFLRPHQYQSKKKGLTLLTLFCLSYIGRVLWIYSKTGTWVYPVFEKLSPVGLAVFFTFSYIFGISIYLIGEKLNHLKWGHLDAETKTQVPQEEKPNPQELSGTERG